jgi:hypothetical protein
MTPEQLATLKAAIAADPVLAAYPSWAASSYPIAAAFNELAITDFYVWKTDANINDVFDAVDWAKLTPADAPDSTATYTNRALLCQAKQLNLQILMQGRSSINAAKLKVRQGLTDSLQNVPAGVSGALLDAGWIAVKQTLYRKATRAEKLFATGTGTTGVPATMSFEGVLSPDDVQQARES